MRFVTLFLLLVAPAQAWSASVTVNASKDNTIYQSNSSFSAGGAAGIFSGSTGQGSPRRGLLAFDVAANVPAGSLITGAQLTLYLGAVSNSTSATIGLHTLTRDWGEGTAGSSTLTANGGGMGFAASAGDATWSDAKLGSVAWNSAGATGDFNAVPSATTSVGGPVDTPFSWSSTAALVADVQSWLNNPATNFGWALVSASEGTGNSVKSFYSRSATQNSTNVPNSLDLLWRPALTITYIPEPAAILLMILAGPVLFFFRRRPQIG